MASSLLIFATKIAARSTTKAPTTTAPPFYVPLPPTQTRESTSVIIDLQPGQFPYLLCWYPISVRKLHPFLLISSKLKPQIGKLLHSPTSPLLHNDNCSTCTPTLSLAPRRCSRSLTYLLRGSSHPRLPLDLERPRIW